MSNERMSKVKMILFPALRGRHLPFLVAMTNVLHLQLTLALMAWVAGSISSLVLLGQHKCSLARLNPHPKHSIIYT